MQKTSIRDMRLLMIFFLVLIIFISKIPTIQSAVSQDQVLINKVENQEFPMEIIYTVQKGDCLYKIATKYKVHLWQIRQWNNLGYDSCLHPGQELIIKQVDYESCEGLASWYGPGFHGQNMANGQVYNMYDIVVAHRTIPLGRKVKVTNLENGKSIIAPVLDRGPYVKSSQGKYTREIDLSYAVAQELGTIQKGVVLAKIEPINEPLESE